MKDNISFRLRGKNFRLSRREIEEKLRDVPPRPVDKYSVNISGRLYPPKQVVEVALGMPPIAFTTMDANRILSKLGIGVSEKDGGGRMQVEARTESESLFEEYLRSSGLTDFDFERNFAGTSKKPDYSLRVDRTEVLFEVKEFRAEPDDFKPGGGAYDPYAPIRQKIEEGRRKFQAFKNYCCGLVLYNRDKPLVHLKWQFVYGAALGNLAIRMPFHPEGGMGVDEAKVGFFGGSGKMMRNLDGKPVETQNTTIAAILILEQLDVGMRRFEKEVSRRELELGRKLTLEEFSDLVQSSRGTERDVSWRQLRVVVHENPFARKPLPKNIFRGPYDDRYGLVENTIKRVFAGEEILKLESAEMPRA